MQHHPLPEYPRPALRRDSYENLNGLWQYAITSSAGLPAKWDGDILVPYSPETKASGAFLQRRISVVWTMRVRASRTVAFCPSS